MIKLKRDTSGNVVVRFSEYHLVHAALVGFFRQIECREQGRQNSSGLYGDGWENDINGAIGEAAVAFYIDRFWSMGGKGQSDVGKYEVRTALSAHYRLILHDHDHDDKIFFLVTAKFPEFTIRGWLRAADGKQEKYWCDPKGGRPAYFVPQSDIRPLSEFRDSMFRDGAINEELPQTPAQSDT